MNAPPEPGSAEELMRAASRGLGRQLRLYRRAWWRLRDSAKAFGRDHRFAFNIKHEEETGLLVRIEVPDLAKTHRFIESMRPFLAKGSDTNAEAVWSAIKATFPDKLDGAVRARIDGMLEASRSRMPFTVTIHEKEWTAETAYHYVADGAFFTGDVDAANFRKAVLEAEAGIALEYLFYDYQLTMFRVVSAIFGLAFHVEDRKPLRVGPCIYCRSEAGPFRSEEHVYPQGLGQDEIVLPPGFVCDPCNNALAPVDSYIVESPIAVMRILAGGPTKTGKYQSAKFQNVSVEKVSPHKLSFDIKGKDDESWQHKELPDGTHEIKMQFKSKEKLNAELLGRGMCKIALAMLAYKHHPSLALDPKYDEVRRFVRHGGSFPNNVAISKKAEPKSSITTTWTMNRGTIFVFDIYGVQSMVNLEPEPIIAFPPERTIVIPLV